MTTKSDTPRTDGLDSRTTGRTWALACGEHIELSRQLERELAAASEKLSYIHSMGLRFGMMQSSDRPKPYLMHTWTEDSDHERMFREWSHSIGREARLAAMTTRAEKAEAELSKLKKENGELRTQGFSI